MAKKKAAKELEGGGTNSGGIAVKKAARKKASKKTEADGKVAGQNPKFAPEQDPLKGMEEVDERVPELDEECQRVLANTAKRSTLKEDTDERLENIGKLLEQNGLDCYFVRGEKFFVEPGVKKVKHLKVQQKG